MQNMQVEFSFRGRARLKELWNLLTKGKVFTFLTEGNILSIWKQYIEQRTKEQLYSKQPPAKVVEPKKH